MNIYIANLDNAIDDERLKELFSPYGEVKSAEVALDVFTGVSRGFGFVDMEDRTAAQAAISELHQTVLHTLTITVEEAPAKRVQQSSYKVGNGVASVYRFKRK